MSFFCTNVHMKPDTLAPLIRRAMASVHDITGHGGIYLDLQESAVQPHSAVCAFCAQCLRNATTATLCRFTYGNAALQSIASGEPYYCRCWAGLLCLTVAIAPDNACRGGLSFGGFIASGEHDDVRDQLLRHLPNPEARVQEFLPHLASLREITPEALRGLGAFILETTFSSGLNSAQFFRRQNEIYLQQRHIAEAAAEMRQRPITDADILANAYQLVDYLRRHDPEGAMRFVSTYLAELLTVGRWDLARLKAHVRVLLAVITAYDLLRGVPWAAATSRELRRMQRLEQARTTEESCYEVAEWIRQHFHGEEEPLGRQPRPLAVRAAEWLRQHYQEQATVRAAARALGVSVSTLSHRLPRETGKTFRELLTETRVAEAKKLLATTGLTLSEIGAHCGFFDQAHFTRQFKRHINLTPGEFRRLLHFPDEVLRPAAPTEKRKGRPIPAARPIHPLRR